MSPFTKILLLKVLLLTVSIVGLTCAQTETGQIEGSVSDPAGAAVPGASVQIKSTHTGAARETTSGGGGDYAVTNLLPDTYEVTVSAAGFEGLKQTVEVGVGAKVGADFHLKIGTATTVVQVSESAIQVNSETQTLSQTITSQDITALPTISRNPYDLVKTVGNVSEADPGQRGVGVSINGLRSSSVAVLLDGVSNSNAFDTTVAIQVPQDSMGEFNVVTGDFTAEYGGASGGVVNVATKQGTNTFHGSAYEFNRVSDLAANSFANNAFSIPKSVFTRNQFGFSVGGPIIKDKLFFFDNAEWTRVRSVASVQAVVPTSQLVAASAPATQQFFSAYGKLKSNVQTSSVFTAANLGCTTGPCAALPAGTPLYQTVTYGVASDAGGGLPANTWNDVGRIDYNLSAKTQLYFRYARQVENDFVGTQTNSPYVGYDTANFYDNQGYGLSITHALTANQVSQTKISYNRISDLQPLGTQPVGPTLYTTINNTLSLGGNSILYPGYSPDTPGNAIPFGGPQNQAAINEDYSVIAGKHQFRFGGEFTYLQDNRAFGAYAEAVEALGSNLSTALNNLLSGQLSIFQAAVYPQGKFPCINGVQTPACTLTLPVGPPSFTRSNRYHDAALYGQDSWKIIPRFTLNLGLRWEYFGPQANGNQNLDSNFYLGSGSNLELQAGAGTVQIAPQSPKGGLWQKNWTNFAPRVGFAWDLTGDGKTSLRGGYGIGYERNFGNVTFNLIQNPPNYGVIALQAGADVPTIPITTNNAGPLAGNSGTKALGRVTLRAVNPDIKTAYAHTWSLALERQLSTDAIFGLEYSGSLGENLYTVDQLNLPGTANVYAGVTGARTRINPQYSTINFRTNSGTSLYNGLNTKFELRNFRHSGLSLRANYTWSHSIDDSSSSFTTDSFNAVNLGYLNPLNPGLDRGSSDFDVRHRIAISAEYSEPFFKKGWASAILGGWNLSPIFNARTGSPFTVFDCSNSDGNRCPRLMEDTTLNAKYTDIGTGRPNEFQYLNLGTPDTSYVNSATGDSDFGPFPANMTGRNSFRTPGAWTFNVAASKTFSFAERYKLDIRAEAFNIANHSNLYLVWSNTEVSSFTGTVANPSLAIVTATRGQNNSSSFTSATVNNGRLENRNIQLALRLSF